MFDLGEQVTARIEASYAMFNAEDRATVESHVKTQCQSMTVLAKCFMFFGAAVGTIASSEPGVSLTTNSVPPIDGVRDGPMAGDTHESDTASSPARTKNTPVTKDTPSQAKLRRKNAELGSQTPGSAVEPSSFQSADIQPKLDKGKLKAKPSPLTRPVVDVGTASHVPGPESDDLDIQSEEVIHRIVRRMGAGLSALMGDPRSPTESETPKSDSPSGASSPKSPTPQRSLKVPQPVIPAAPSIAFTSSPTSGTRPTALTPSQLRRLKAQTASAK